MHNYTKASWLVLACIIPIFLISCDEDDLWQVEDFGVSGPLLKTTANLENVTDFYEVQDGATLSTDMVGLPHGQYSQGVPAFTYEDTIILGTMNISENFINIQTNTINFGMTLDNQLPIPLAPGTEVVFYNTGTTDEVHSFTLNESVDPFETRVIELELEELFFEGDIDLGVRNFSSPGTSESVNINQNNYIGFTFDYVFVDIHSVSMRPDREYIIVDTSAFEAFDDEDDNNEGQDPTEVIGELRVYSGNAYPLEIDIQLHFLDEHENVVLTFFEDADFKMEPANVEPQSGEVLEVIESVGVVPVDRERWELLKASTRVLVEMEIRSFHLNEPTRIVAENSMLELQIVADLIINPQ